MDVNSDVSGSTKVQNLALTYTEPQQLLTDVAGSTKYKSGHRAPAVVKDVTGSTKVQNLALTDTRPQ